MKKRAVCFMLFLFIMVNVMGVLALDTEIKIKTYANHDVDVNVLDPSNEDALLEHFEQNTEGTGQVSFTHSSDKNKVSIVVIVRKDGKMVEINGEKIHKFENHAAGTFLNVELVPKKVEETTEANITEANITEETTNETANEIVENTEENTSVSETEAIEQAKEENELTGASISETKEFLSKNIITIIIVGVFVAAAIVIFFIFKTKIISAIKQPLISNKNIKIRKYSEIKNELKVPSFKDNKKLDELEEQVKSIQAEIEEIKNKKTKIKEVEERLKRDMQELDRLKRE